jgi:hypothetical protein
MFCSGLTEADLLYYTNFKSVYASSDTSDLFFSGEKLDADRALNSTLQVITRNGVEVSATVKTISLSGCYRCVDISATVRTSHYLAATGA